MLLALLAAILMPKDEPHFGLERAMRFYVESVLFSHELPPVNSEELIRAFGSLRLQGKLVDRDIARITRTPDKTLTMGPPKLGADDEVLRYLKDNGLTIRTVKGVREFLKQWHDRNKDEIPIDMRILAEWRRKTGAEFIAQFQRPKWRYEFPELLLTRAARYSVWTKSESRHKSAETKRKTRSKQTESNNISAKKSSGVTPLDSRS